MKEKTKRADSKFVGGNYLSTAVFWFSAALLFLLPLIFSASVQAVYALPKFLLLLVVASVIALLLAVQAGRENQFNVSLFKSKIVKLVGLYLAVIALTTFLSVAPRVSLFGSSSNFMGVITRLCFFICFCGLIAAVGSSQERLLKALWVMTVCGGLVAAYAVAQFFGLDFFAPASVYTFQTALGDVKRVCSSIGHSNYLGNFLLYTTPVSAALAITSNKKARLLALAVTVLSLLAIVFSVARGAWLGILIGIITFAVLESKQLLSAQMANRKNLWRFVAVFAVSLAMVISLIAMSPASVSIKERVQALIAQGVSSSGRLILWRDSLKMLPKYALTGCGAEGFRKAFLVYKSREVTKLSQPNNNESSHNSYLDALLSYGVFGLALYLAIIFFALTTLLRVRRRAPSQTWRIIISGIAASFVAILAHNFFIFDQLSTGLYFFAFVALAVILPNVFGDNAGQDKALPQSFAAAKDAKTQDKHRSAQDLAKPSGLRLWTARLATILAGCGVLFAVWYAAGLIEAEREFNKIFEPTIARNFPEIAKHCEAAASSPLPTGAYEYRVARALETYAQGLFNFANAGGQASPEANNLLATRTAALQLASAYAEKSLPHTNTPDLHYSALGSIALALGDKDKLKFAATEAVKSDPSNFYIRWLMAEAYLANGEKDAAVNEANLSLELKPDFLNAASVLARVQSQIDIEKARKKLEVQRASSSAAPERSVAELLVYARQLSQQGNLQKAKRKLLLAIVRSQSICVDCHRELAVVYEKLGLYANAILEWQTVAQHTTEAFAAESISAHLERLKQKTLMAQD